MEKLQYKLTINNPQSSSYSRNFALAGVVSSSNLEVMLEVAELQGYCEVTVNTSAPGYEKIWEAVVNDFAYNNDPSNLRVSINDFGASPSVVALRLDQAMEILNSKEGESI